MEINCTSPSPLGSGWGRQGCLLERQSISPMLNCSLMNTPDGIARGLTTPSSSTVCSCMLPRRGRRKQRFICQGWQHGLPRPDLKVDVPAIQLVGYWASQKEIWDLYHEVYFLRRLPSPQPCGPQWWEEAIQDIPSSLRSHLWRWGAPPCWRRTNGGLPQPPPAHPSTRIPIQVPGESWPPWWGSLRGQRGSPVGIGGHLHAWVEYWKTEPESRECPTPMPPQPQQQPPAE